MAYTKNAAPKKPYSGFKKSGGSFQKKEYDPTIVSSKDIGIARANAVTAVYTLESARVAAGLPQVAQEELDASIERIFTESVAKFDHPRIGSAKKAAPAPVETAPAVAKAEDAVEDAFGSDEETEPTSDAQSAPHADLVLNSGMHAGNTLADVYEEAPEYVTDFLADPKKNKNTFTLKRAQEFVAALA